MYPFGRRKHELESEIETKGPGHEFQPPAEQSIVGPLKDRRTNTVLKRLQRSVWYIHEHCSEASAAFSMVYTDN